MFLTALSGRNLKRDVGSVESGNLILIGVLGIGFVRRAVGQMQVERVGPLADQQALARQRDSRCRWIG